MATKCAMCSGGGEVRRPVSGFKQTCPECNGRGFMDHTPGPWAVSKHPTSLAGHLLVSAPQEPVAEALDREVSGRGRTRANANLIAAAPEMHAALVAAEEMLGRLLEYETEAFDVKHAASLVRSALAHAKGETVMVTL